MRTLVIGLVTRKEVGRLTHSDQVRAMQFSPDGRFLVTTAGRSVWLWAVKAVRAVKRFPAFRKHAEAPAFHPAGRLFGSGSRDGEVRLWDAAGCRQVASLDWQIGAIHGLAFSPDGMTVAAAGHKGTVVVWDCQ
jgi:WD40 repeat protein